MTRGRAGAAKLIRQGEPALADHCVLMTRRIFLLTRRLDEFDSNTPTQGRSPAL
jgi:hypothetical protein